LSASPVLIAAVGDATHVGTWSGIPYHELLAGNRAGLIDGGLPLSVDAAHWKRHRFAWNLKSLLSGRGWGGFQYSTEFLERLWNPVRARIQGARVINCFPLYPPSILRDGSIELWFHLDQTLTQLFDHYGQRDLVAPAVASNALELERKGYTCAAGIVMHSEWARRSVIDDCGISPEKVHVVVPGANIDPDVYEEWERGHRAPEDGGWNDDAETGPLRLVFVGRRALRKGLDRLLRAMQIVRAEGRDCTLRIIGCPSGDVPRELRMIPGVEWYGLIDKGRDPVGYLDAVAECQVGCLLSRAEAGGIGLREYHALGLAVIGPKVGGSPEHVFPEAAILVRPDDEDHAVAEAIRALDDDRHRLAAMRAASWRRRRDATWAAAMEQMGRIMG